MATYTITFDGRNNALKKVLELFVALGGRVEEGKTTEKYDPEFVEMLRKGEEDFKAGNYKVIKTEDIWK